MRAIGRAPRDRVSRVQASRRTFGASRESEETLCLPAPGRETSRDPRRTATKGFARCQSPTEARTKALLDCEPARATMARRGRTRSLPRPLCALSASVTASAYRAYCGWLPDRPRSFADLARRPPSQRLLSGTCCGWSASCVHAHGCLRRVAHRGRRFAVNVQRTDSDSTRTRTSAASACRRPRSSRSMASARTRG